MQLFLGTPLGVRGSLEATAPRRLRLRLELARRALVRRLRHSRHLQFAILEVLHQTTQRLRLRGVAPDALELLPRPGGDERAAAVGVQGAAQAHAREPLVEGLGDAERRVVLLLAFPRVHLGIHGRRRREVERAARADVRGGERAFGLLPLAGRRLVARATGERVPVHRAEGGASRAVLHRERLQGTTTLGGAVGVVTRHLALPLPRPPTAGTFEIHLNTRRGVQEAWEGPVTREAERGERRVKCHCSFLTFPSRVWNVPKPETLEIERRTGFTETAKKIDSIAVFSIYYTKIRATPHRPRGAHARPAFTPSPSLAHTPLTSSCCCTSGFRP